MPPAGVANEIRVGKPRIFPDSPDPRCVAFNAGGNFTSIEPEPRMVLVTRWIDTTCAAEFLGTALKCLVAPG